MGSHRRLAPSPGLDRGTTVAVGLLSAAAAALGALPATAVPHDDPTADVDRLYEEAERATEAYNEADSRADTLRGRINTVQDEIARQQERVNTLRESLGSLAGAQYRSGGLDASLILLLSDDPEDYLERASVLDRLTVRQAGRLKELQKAGRSLDQNRARASHKLEELERSRKAAAAHKKTVERKLAEARRLLDALPDAERAAYERAARSGRSGPLGTAAASGRAADAVAAAGSALGSPYVWGANGPSGFDCSGLMQWSYAQAGVALPRTSQAQRHAGRQVPLSQARPGDLVLYRSDASHVGMYAGNGQVIHAPYPGAPVRYDPVGMMPVSSVTRV
ncbi:C40 family peptidase [Streptomyces sp. M2CJ-2]|uniref:C40 family peptidase n=1 Tax=Streptomyces sp. M2CJ-2 TaxID=2803948 RepID=UPI001928F8C4|nr:C40 family peptidase [Streptomyces sp. M2CJ-2]MBL3668705.1 C40 family peptidase [Streptomyces sp. M2CJ-2]